MTPLLVLALGTAAIAALRGMWSPCGLSMLSSLNPVAERGRGHRWWVTALWYVAGAVVGGAVLGGCCAGAAAGVAVLPGGAATRWSLALAGAVVAVLADSTWTRLHLPVHPRQVDERWLVAYRRWIYAGGYGVQIGTGFATYIMTAGVYLTALLAALTGSPGAAFAVGVTFGAVRGLGVLVTLPARTPERLRALIARVDALGPACLQLCALAATVVASGAAGRLAGSMAATVVFVPLALLSVGRRGRSVPAAAR